MNTRRRGHYSNKNNNSLFNDLSKKIKDYIIPIIGGILILFLIWSFFFKSDSKKQPVDTGTGMNISKDSDTTASIFYTGGKKVELEEGMKLFKTEKIVVGSGRVKIENENVSFNLNKLGDLAYLESGDFKFDSGEVWVDVSSTTNIDMKFAKLKVYPESHISLSQNEMNSTIYVVSGKVEVSNLVGKNTILGDSEKIEVTRAEASDSKVDLSIKKEPLNDYFLKSDWFTLNNGSSYIGTGNVEETSTGISTGSTDSTSQSNNIKPGSGKSKYITFSNLLDESNVSSNIISISGVYDMEEVAKIDVNGKDATLNEASGTFKIEGISVPNKTNDIVFKIFDKNEDLKEKFVYTVYYDGVISNSTNNSNQNTATSNSFDIDGTKFTFTAPISGTTYSTYEDFITIRGNVTASGIDQVTVNDFKLNSFNGKTWRYHASTDYGNLVSGTNIYEIKYFSKGVLVYKNFYTIIKRAGLPVQTTTNTTTTTTNLNNTTTINNSSNSTTNTPTTEVEETATGSISQ